MKHLALVTGLLALASMGCTPGKTRIESPSGNISVEIHDKDSLVYSVSMEGRLVVDHSALGLQFDGMTRPSENCIITGKSFAEIHEPYQTRGKHTEAVDHCNEIRIDLLHQGTGIPYQLHLRVYDDGIAIRYAAENKETFHISGEATRFHFAGNANAWVLDSEGRYMDSYSDDGFGTSGHHQPPAGHHQRVYQAMYFETELALLEDGSMIGGPILLKLMEPCVYAWLAEGALLDYPGSRYLITGPNQFGISFPEEDGWSVDGPFTTPWRLLVLSDDLNGIVNTDMHTSVCPPPAPDLANAGWIIPGRATWSWYSSNTGGVEMQKQYARWASELGFEYNLIDWHWEDFFTAEGPYRNRDPWEVMKEVVDYSRDLGVRTWVWQESDQLKDAARREEYFRNIVKTGIVGVKIDFFDTENKETIDYMQAIMEEAAGHKIMLNFHGTPKPTGLSRTYPHELCREAVRGSEWHTRRWGGGRELTPENNVITVFTRDVIGNNDFTPVVFDPLHLQGFTRTNQLAQAICYTSPLVHWCDQPHFYINSEVKDLIMSIPTLWEKTIVLDPSHPGKLAAIARYDGSRWFVGIMNGEKRRKEITIDLGFLGDGRYDAVLAGDDPNGDPLEFDRSGKQAVTGKETLNIQLSPAGGFVAMFTPSD